MLVLFPRIKGEEEVRDEEKGGDRERMQKSQT